MDTLDLIQTTDAQVWAQEFMRLFGDRLDEIDEGLMIGWFANAIETGRTAGSTCGPPRVDLHPTQEKLRWKVAS